MLGMFGPVLIIVVTIILLICLFSVKSADSKTSLKSTGSHFDWTKALRIMNKFFMIISVVLGFIIGYVLSIVYSGGDLAFVVAIVSAVIFGVIGFVVVAFSMVVVEISQNAKINAIEAKKHTELLEKIAANTTLDKTQDGLYSDYNIHPNN